MGLSSTLYKGHIFWDADAWDFPVLALTDPDLAKNIPRFRLNTIPVVQAHDPDDMSFPWEISKNHHDFTPLSIQRQEHITGDVAFMLNQAEALGLEDLDFTNHFAGDMATYYRSLAFESMGRPKGRVNGPIEIRKVMGPDEYEIVNNDLYTNCLAQWLQDRYGQGETAPFPKGTKIIYKLPAQNSNILLTHDGDPVRNYQQADAILAIYPLQNREAEKQARSMMERFPPKVNPQGPAMSNSINAVIWARLNEPEKAYKEWETSWRDFTDHPLMLFSEQRRKDRTYFVTGAAGCLQSVIYGFLGFRIDSQQDPEAVWTKKLRGDSWLTIKPHLPSAWRSITFKNFSLLGRRYTLTATHTKTTVIQGEP